VGKLADGVKANSWVSIRLPSRKSVGQRVVRKNVDHAGALTLPEGSRKPVAQTLLEWGKLRTFGEYHRAILGDQAELDLRYSVLEAWKCIKGRRSYEAGRAKRRKEGPKYINDPLQKNDDGGLGPSVRKKLPSLVCQYGTESGTELETSENKVFAAVRSGHHPRCHRRSSTARETFRSGLIT